jgi:fluoride exporter
MGSAFNRLRADDSCQISLGERRMVRMFLVGAGGFIGTILRYMVNLGLEQWTYRAGFPFATFMVNFLGCLVIGFLSHFAESEDVFTRDARAFIFVGLLGGFTTFSSFGNETVALFRGHREMFAVINIASHLVFGLGAVWLGRFLGQQVR